MSKLDQLRALREAKAARLEARVTEFDEPIVTRGGEPQRVACVYRHFSKDGALLYVGVSVSPVARSEDHCSGSGWFRQIVRIELEWFPSHPEAIAAERVAIRSENPKFNKIRYEGKSFSKTPRGRTGRPRIHGSNAARQRAYRERRRAA